MKNNFDHTFIQFIKALNVPVTKTGASERLLSHPDEGSLLAYSETLSLFKIENAGIKVDTHRLHELPTPFVAYLHQYGGTFSLVKEVTDDHVHQLDTQQGWLKICFLFLSYTFSKRTEVTILVACFFILLIS